VITRRGFGLAASAALLGTATSVRAAARRSERMLLAGTRWETPCFEVDSGRDGRTVLVVAGIHGNETAPPNAARELAALTPLRGRLVVVPEVNRHALDKRTRYTPGARHADLNRNFPVPDRREARGEIAHALWALTTSLSPNWVLDLHEGWGFSKSSKSMGSSIVHAPHPEHDLRPLADELIATVNATIGEAHKTFTVIGPGPKGSFARAVVDVLGTPAFVFETTWTQDMALRVAQHRLLVTTLLADLGVIHA
jgi:hypothetical protein